VAEEPDPREGTMKHRSVTIAGPDWLGLVAGAAALGSCYGTLALVTILAALGITPGLDDRSWTAAITLFTLVAVGAIALGCRHHGHVGSALLAVAGAGLILWTLFGGYNLVAELAGFAALMVAAAWDWHLRRARA